MKINWKVFAVAAIPGFILFMIVHNYFFYQEPPFETIGDVVQAIASN